VTTLRVAAALVVAATVASCSAGGPTAGRSDKIATVPVGSSASTTALPDRDVLTTSASETTVVPRQQVTTVPDPAPVVSAPPLDMESLAADVQIERTSLTEEAALGSESSLFSLVTTPDGDTLIAGAARDEDLSVATLWSIDPESGATEQRWVLPSPAGIAATARDVVVLTDGSMIVVGALFAIGGTVPVWWRVSGDTSEQMLTMPCGCASAEAERVVTDREGRVWVVGRDPGWRGELLVWGSSDDGRSWVEPLTQLTGPERTLLVAPLDHGVAVLHWTSSFESSSDSTTGWTSSVFVMDGDEILRASAVEVALEFDERLAVDLTAIDGRLWMATSGPTHVSLWSSPDGATWDMTTVPVDDFADDPYVVPIAVESVGGDVGLVIDHGDSIDDHLTLIVFDGHGFETLPTTVGAPAYYERYIDAWPVAASGDGVLVLDPGWASTPSLKRLDRDESEVVEIPEIPPMRRVERERVWALTAGTEAVVATIYRQYTTGHDQWVDVTPRLMIGSGESWTPIEVPSDLQSVVGVVAVGDGFEVASLTPVGTVFTPVSSDGVVVDLGDVEVAPFYAQRVISTGSGRIVAHTFDAMEPIWVKEPDTNWAPLPPLPTTDAEVRRVCAGDDIVVAVAVTEPDQVVVYAYETASWTSIGTLPPKAASDNEDPRCAATADTVMVAFRSLIIAPEQFSSEWWLSDRSGSASLFGYFDPQWPADRITDLAQAAPGDLGMAAGIRNDDEGSYDAVAWMLNGLTPTTPVFLAGGPGIQEARAVVKFGDQTLVGGIDAGAAVIWSITSDH
jgi:hypothetical protein